MTWKKSKKKIIAEYSNQFKKFGFNNKSLFFPGRKQNVRFQIIKEIGIQKTDSVLDVGCGFGDLYFF